MISRRRFTAIAGMMIGGATAVQAADAQQIPPTKLLRVVPSSDLKILDTTWTTTYVTIRYGYLVYDTLFALDSKFEPKPQMVESFDVSPDSMTYTFKLRDGLKWHDGAPVTAKDCVASLTRWAKKNPIGEQMSRAMDGYEVVDDRTFRIKLRTAFGLVIDALANAQSPAFIMPERIASQSIDKADHGIDRLGSVHVPPRSLAAGQPCGVRPQSDLCPAQ